MPRSASIATIICALLAAFAWQQAAAEEVQAVRFPHRELSCLQLVLEARALLATYDRLLADVPLTDRPPIFIDSLSEMRQDLLMKALSAWYFVGPKPLPADDRAVLAVLGMQGNDYAWFQMPESLDELVQFGYLPHLPESPAGVAEDYISALPEGREAAGGSILYLPLRAAEPYMCAKPGMIEGWVLASFAVREQNFLPAELAAESFGGDLAAKLGRYPSNLLAVRGQDSDYFLAEERAWQEAEEATAAADAETGADADTNDVS